MIFEGSQNRVCYSPASFVFLRICLLLTIFLAHASPEAEAQPRGVANSKRFLDSLQRDTFRYFWDLGDNPNGLIPDRHPTPSFASIAATGFGLTAYVLGVERGYVSRPEAAERTLRTLRFFNYAPQLADAKNATGYRGFFYHFLDMKTGLRFKQVELSTIDTALLLAGMLSSQTYFNNNSGVEKEIRMLVDRIFRRVDWKWMQERKPLIAMGWQPESGFIKSDWKGYNEAMLLYILSLASPTYPVEPNAWTAWTSTYEWKEFKGYSHVNFDPLFGHQYSHIWIDFRSIRDAYMREKGIDYFENSRRATLANRAYCVENPGGFPGYGADLWGLTASDGPKDTLINGRQFFSYRARGAAATQIVDDGTIAPTAAGGSIPFTPEESLRALQVMKYRFDKKIYGSYGFKDAFNLSYPGHWFDPDYLGIDSGPILLMAENYRTNLIWNLMMRNPTIRRGLLRAGFRGGWLKGG
ncbi:glucoamylase family protein [Larkinella terrae]|uniref:Tat pathway signal protein n=1 Tax=Larkinella terrae TaxID=2025311 RepID=A0A7K0ERD4_9BACT|nr:glucoamylase family protein [Larkinella terrae]MRS63978.1 Tat pathway signal protein [Larkinella terrae]